ncbi:MAG: ThuA domain-containing protein, partial [Planctomycetales bacterium]|nr:ThuA domain-containing protein [Planctomycetales bacterium]
VVHNECYGGVTDVEFIERMVRGHAEQGVPLVVIHCSMHSYRNARTDEWRKLLGVTSKRHESVKRPLAVVSRDADHPIMRGIPTNWSTPNGELYIIEHNWPDCHILATAKSVETNKDETVVWVNQYGKAKTFGTTLGHHNETMMTNEWLATVSRGLLWVCGKLGDDGTIGDGYSGTGISPIILPTVGGGSEQKPTEAKR